MARKVVSRKALRDEADAVEALERAGKTAKGASAAEEKTAKKPTKRKSRAKEPAVIRLKLLWGVYNQSMKCVAKYDYVHKKAAEQKAAELTASGKSPHFIQKLKETITE